MKLTDRHRQFIVTRLACFYSPSEVQKDLEEAFGLRLGASQIVYYDPENQQAANLAEKWKTLFEETRAAFIRDASSIPVAHKSYRLRQLDEAVRVMKRVGNYALMAALLEQAAKEMGDVYTNRQSLKVDLTQLPDVTKLTDEELDALAERLGLAGDGRAGTAPAR